MLPSFKSLLNLLKEAGCENIIILPLYPQYAAATTATVCDEVYRSLMKMRWQPSLQVIPHYESEPIYINALIKSIEKKVQSINWKPDLIISSYHGIPRKYFDKGDPYHCYCHKTTRLIKEKYSLICIKPSFFSYGRLRKSCSPSALINGYSFVNAYTSNGIATFLQNHTRLNNCFIVSIITWVIEPDQSRMKINPWSLPSASVVTFLNKSSLYL